MRVPDFFIPGAPKCGTSALHTYLREHPGVFMPECKEPHYYATDFPSKRDACVGSRERYLELFAGAPADALCGEASVWYLYSEHAIGNILADNPEAKFIVMLRNPVEVAHALHQTGLRALAEDVPDFERAWRLQDERAQHRHLPRHCREPKFLQYRAASSFAPQVERLCAQVARERILFVLFEHFAAQPAQVYAEVVHFLGLPHCGRQTFPKINASHVRRSQVLVSAMGSLAALLGPAYTPTKRALNAIGLHPGHSLERWNHRPQPRPALDARFKAELVEAFATDVDRLEALLGRSLDVWRAAWRIGPTDNLKQHTEEGVAAC
jgi:hypothetical protein